MNVDFAIITADDSEHKAVIDTFGFDKKDRVMIASRLYWKKSVKTDYGELILITTQLIDQATPSATSLTKDIIHHIQPKNLFLVGVAGAIDDDLDFGDIVIGKEIYYSERGKITKDGKLLEPKMFSTDPELIQIARSIKDESAPVFEMPGNKTTLKRANIHCGVIACGEKVIDYAEFRSGLKEQNRKILAVEMESYGTAVAIHEENQSSKPKFLVIKSIMDNADGSKNDRWKEIAAKNAALFAKSLIDEIISNPNKIKSKLYKHKKVLVLIATAVIIFLLICFLRTNDAAKKDVEAIVTQSPSNNLVEGNIENDSNLLLVAPTPDVSINPQTTPNSNLSEKSESTSNCDEYDDEILLLLDRANSLVEKYIEDRKNQNIDEIWLDNPCYIIKSNVDNLFYTTSSKRIIKILDASYKNVSCKVINEKKDESGSLTYKIETHEVWVYEAELECKGQEDPLIRERIDEYPTQEYTINFIDNNWSIGSWFLGPVTIKQDWSCPK